MKVADHVMKRGTNVKGNNVSKCISHYSCKQNGMFHAVALLEVQLRVLCTSDMEEQVFFLLPNHHNKDLNFASYPHILKQHQWNADIFPDAVQLHHQWCTCRTCCHKTSGNGKMCGCNVNRVGRQHMTTTICDTQSKNYTHGAVTCGTNHHVSKLGMDE
jgi:hypothetical protein